MLPSHHGTAVEIAGFLMNHKNYNHRITLLDQLGSAIIKKKTKKHAWLGIHSAVGLGTTTTFFIVLIKGELCVLLTPQHPLRK